MSGFNTQSGNVIGDSVVAREKLTVTGPSLLNGPTNVNGPLTVNTKATFTGDVCISGNISSVNGKNGIAPLTVTVGPKGQYATIGAALSVLEPTENSLHLVLKLENNVDHPLDYKIMEECLHNVSTLELRGDERALVGSAYIQPSPASLVSDQSQTSKYFEGVPFPSEYGIGKTLITVIGSNTVAVTKVSSPPASPTVQPDFSALVVGDDVTWVDENGILTDLTISLIVGTTLTFSSPIPGSVPGMAKLGTGFAIKPNTRVTEGEKAPITGGILAGSQTISVGGDSFLFKGLHFITNNAPHDTPGVTSLNITAVGRTLLTNCMFGDAAHFVKVQLIGPTNSIGPNSMPNGRLRGVVSNVVLLSATFMGRESGYSANGGFSSMAIVVFAGCRRAFYADRGSIGNVDISQFYNCQRSVEGRNGTSIGYLLTEMFHDPAAATYQQPTTFGVILHNNSSISDTTEPGIFDNLIAPLPQVPLLRVEGCGTGIKLVNGSSATVEGYNPGTGAPFVDNVFVADIDGTTFNDGQFLAAAATVSIAGQDVGSSYIVKGVIV
jgi:hypothetical protein